jgi:hypothetical protein
MLGTLRMDVDTCIKEYLNIAPDIFPVEGIISRSKFSKFVKVVKGKQRFDPTPLEKVVKSLVKKHLADRATRGKIRHYGLKHPEIIKALGAKCMEYALFACEVKPTKSLDLYVRRPKSWGSMFYFEAMRVLGMSCTTAPFGKPVVQLQLHQHSSRP